MVADTGMRLAEAAGLHMSDILNFWKPATDAPKRFEEQ